jgi:uncharacterized protein YecT (DUF1311 family)
MTLKRKTQLSITVSAVLVGLIHLFFPDLKIDAIFITLIIISIIPWLEPLLKSIELPGGLKVEFQDFKKLEDELKIAGLIKSDEKVKIKEITKTKSETFSFIEIAEQNEELALVGFRIEIEKRLRSLADKYSIESNRYSVTRLIETLAKEEILTIAEKTSLIDIISTLNKASHGMEYDQRSANWVIENGPKILESLDEKLEVRGGRISVGNVDEKVHWIDKSFDNCEWTTNNEWGECIKAHSDLWEKEMNRIYQSLIVKLNEGQKKKLIETQSSWLKQIELEKDFIYSFEDLHLKIGSGGISVSAMNFMNKIRERTLELEEVLNILVE